MRYKISFLLIFTLIFINISTAKINADLNDWPTFRFTPQNNGYNSAENYLNPPLKLLWKTPLDSQPMDYPGIVMSNDTVYTKTYTGKLYAINANTGAIRWTTNIQTGGGSGLVVLDTIVYSANSCNNCSIDAFHTETGEKLWSTKSLPKGAVGITVKDGILYAGAHGHYIKAFDITDGKEVWSTDIRSGSLHAPTITNETVYVGDYNGNIYAFNSNTGSIKWENTELSGVIFSSPTFVNNTLYIGIGRKSGVVAINPQNGDIIWESTDTGDVWSSPTIASDTVYVQTLRGQVFALDSNTGEKIWVHSNQATENVSSSVAVANNIVYVGSSDKKIHAINTTTGEVVWQYTTGGTVASPIIADGKILFTSKDGYVYSFTNDSLLDLPYFSQNDPKWGFHEYDHSSQWGFTNTHFERWGCAVTSAAMVLNYHGINRFQDDTPITPGTLNEWLKSHNGYMTGYDENGEGYSVIDWSEVATLTKDLYEAEKAPVQLTHRQYRDNIDPSIVEEDLENEWPVILRVRNNITSSHFVVAKGKLEEDQGKFSINDPEWDYTSLLPFNNSYFQIDRFLKHTFPLHGSNMNMRTLSVSDVNYSYITLVVNGDVDMLITDSSGKRTGTFTENGQKTEFDEIAGASYSLNPALSNPDDFGNPESLGTDVHAFLLPTPTDGDYHITLSGEESQNYSFNMSLMRSNGESLHKKIDGVVTPHFERSITFYYSQTEESNIETFVTFQSTIDDVNEALELKLINRGVGRSIISLLKSAEKDLERNKRFGVFIAKKKLEVITNLLHRMNGKKYILENEAYQIIKYDIEQLKNSLK